MKWVNIRDYTYMYSSEQFSCGVGLSVCSVS